MTLITSSHPDAAQITALLQAKGINSLYHFTSIENLRLICESGALYSKAALGARGLWPCPSPGGNLLSHELDRRNRNWNYISLSFTPYTPMAHRQKQKSHLCFVEIDPIVATYSGVRFYNTNAASTDEQVRKGVGYQGLQLVNLDVMNEPPNPSDRDGWFLPVQAEILVPHSITLDLVRRIVFVSEASHAMAIYETQGGIVPQFQISPNLFSAFSDEEELSFPYVSEFIATTTYESERRPALNSPVKQVSRSNIDRLGLIALTHARPGMSATFYLNDKIVGFSRFMREATYRNYVSVSSLELPLGLVIFKYSLKSKDNDIRWGIYPVNVLP